MVLLSKLGKNSKNKKKRIIGRGLGSGSGKTSGRGHKGSGQRTGSGHLHPGFEGGQMPLMRRTPKRGFNNKDFAKRYQIIQTGKLNIFSDGDVIDRVQLKAKGLIKKESLPVKLLVKGDIKKALKIKVDKASKSAILAMEKSKGSVEIESC